MTTTLEQPDTCQRFEARGAIARLFRCEDEEVLVEGPAGTGKSRGILERIDYLCDQHPGIRVLIARKSRASMSQSVLVTLEDHVWAAGHESLTGARRSHRSSYKYRNGSEIVVAGLDDPERIKSTEYDIIFVNEATEISLNDWEMCVGRLRNGKMDLQQAIADCNPDTPTHWLNKRADAGTMRRLISRHADNPYFYDRDGTPTDMGQSYVLGKLARLSGVRGLRLRDGKWAAAEGVVYDNYDPAIHLIDRFDIPDDWRRARVIDFGYTNPFSCQWYAIDGDGRAYQYREVYGTRRLVEDWAKIIHDVSGDETYEVTIADHDAEDRATLERHGIKTIAAHKAVSPGVEAVQSRLRVEDDGKARLFIMRDGLVERDTLLTEAGKPTCLAEEIPGYTYPPGVDGRPNKEAPVKADDHACDGMRYLVAWLDGLGKEQVYIGGSMLEEEQPQKVYDIFDDDEDDFEGERW